MDDAKQLAETDMTDYVISYRDRSRADKTIRAAYIAPYGEQPGMLAFRDWQHETVALVSHDVIAAVERQEPETRAVAGFRPTSQILQPTWMRPMAETSHTAVTGAHIESYTGIAATSPECPE